MPQDLAFPDGGYRFVKGPFQFSGGVAAEPGFEVERARFPRPVALEAGFRAIEAHFEAVGRPLTAFCACELRSPAPFTDTGFTEFNRLYVGTLEKWGVYRNGVNPVARSNVCPEKEPPATPSFYAFSYTVPPRGGARPTFVIAGCGEAPEGQGSYRDRIIRYGDTSPDALREKAHWVHDEIERRMRALGVGWGDATATQVYTVHDLHPFLADEIAGRAAMPAGLTWHFARPPVIGLDYEVDVRGVRSEIVI